MWYTHRKQLHLLINTMYMGNEMLLYKKKYYERSAFWRYVRGEKQSSAAVLLMSGYILAQFMRGYAILHQPLSKVHFIARWMVSTHTAVWPLVCHHLYLVMFRLLCKWFTYNDIIIIWHVYAWISSIADETPMDPLKWTVPNSLLSIWKRPCIKSRK